MKKLEKNNLLTTGTTPIDRIILTNLSPFQVTDLSQLRRRIDHHAFSVEDLYCRLQFFQACGLAFNQLNKDGCRLEGPLDLLDTDQIHAQLPASVSSLIESLTWHSVTESTNKELLNATLSERGIAVCMAEYQTRGRGRHGRNWIAPFAASLCLSVCSQISRKIDNIQLISFLPAVALIRVLHQIGIQKVGVKWPNDVICNGQKLAGILIDMTARGAVVIGIGINVYNRAGYFGRIQQPWTSIDQHLTTVPPRNELTSLILSELVSLMQVMENQGLDGIREEWSTYDLCRDKHVIMDNGSQILEGIAQGITRDGSLCVEIGNETKYFISGEISIRGITDLV